MRVLQIEDDKTTAKVVAETLKSKGFSCDIAHLGEDAVDLALQNHYDLILLDIMLPDIDGYEVLRRLRDADIHTPVVIQSALTGQQELEQGLAAGAVDRLVKPFSGYDLRECVSSILERAGSEELGHTYEAPANETNPRRRHPRVKTLKSAQIIYKHSTCTCDCLVVNMSAGGAALKIPENLEVPESFVLQLQNGPMFHCHVCWRHGDKVGVMFIEQTIKN